MRLKQKHIQDISRGKVSALLLADEGQSITVHDKLELINDDTNEAVGTLEVKEVVIRQLKDFEKQDDVLVHFVTQQGFNPTVATKRINFAFHPHAKTTPVERNDVNLYTNLSEVKMYADGGSRGNPGPSASGWVLFDIDGSVLKEGGKYLGITTNNQAEYQALKFGLEDAKKMQVKRVQVYMDSLLVINQMKGIFKVKNRDLWPIYEAIRELAKSFQKVTFTHVPRELNKEADRMVNETLDANQ